MCQYTIKLIAPIIIVALGCDGTLYVVARDASLDTDSDGDSDTGTGTETDVPTDNDTDTNTDFVDWVIVPGGTYLMGSVSNEDHPEQLPIHEVEVDTFEIAHTETTVFQYQECFLSGGCLEEPKVGDLFNWGEEGRGNHPINGVTWFQARAFCEWVGGRLPSEAEWEFIARSGGQEIIYPWGNDAPDCEYAVMDEDGPGTGYSGCEENGTSEICSCPLGGTTNTAPEICDLSGNLWEWVEDNWHDNYEGAPDSGISWIDEGNEERVVRGGSFGIYQTDVGMPGRYRDSAPENEAYNVLGFRCAR